MQDIQLKYMAYQFDSVEHFSLFTDLLYVHLGRKIAMTIFTEAITEDLQKTSNITAQSVQVRL